jgi:hypothetical protein
LRDAHADRFRRDAAPTSGDCADRDIRSGQGGGEPGRRALLPIALLKDHAFVASNLASGSVYFVVYGLSFALATSLPDSLSASWLRTGLYMTPPAMPPRPSVT